METVIRIKNIEVKNIKNVKHGLIKTNTTFEDMRHADVIGIYGQNGSGKTAIVEAFSIFKTLLSADELPKKDNQLLMLGERAIEIAIEFYIINAYGEHFVEYEVCLTSDYDRLKVIKEKVSYKENLPGKRLKEIISKDEDMIRIRNKVIKSDLKVMLANELSRENSTGFIFRDELFNVYKNALSTTEFELIKNLAEDFNANYHIIDNEQNGWILANIMMPFSVHLKSVRGNFPYELQEPMLLPNEEFEIIKKVILQVNIVLEKLIPGLSVIAKSLHSETMDDGEEGTKFEFLSNRNNITLPLRCESAGVLKLISILSTLIAVFNKPNACVVIDELDSGVFEYLLGEILEVISGNGKGQLIFTSHNLRVLEVLNYKNLWFSTLNDNNRFIQLKGINKNSNTRDVYLRAVQLGGQEEELYKETDYYDIKKAFRTAGGFNG